MNRSRPESLSVPDKEGPPPDPRGLERTVAAYALGCKANQEEMECLLTRLGEAGYRVVPFGQPAGWTIVNTCTVTAAGDSDSRQRIRQAVRTKGHGRVVVTGCLAQREPEVLGSIPGVSWVVGNGEKSYLADSILQEEDVVPGGVPAGPDEPAWVRVGTDPTLERFPAFGSAPLELRTRATLKIQDGCDEHCTFCVIPSVRGRSRSRPLEDVVRQAETRVRAGHREVALTGINTSLWGRDLPGLPELPSLLAALDRVQGLERVRLNSLEPQYVTEAWLDWMAASPRLCRHLHLPLQSGSAEVLQRMNRRYTPERYASLVRAARTRMPDAAIGCDILVGFPGETPDHFEESIRFLRVLPLAYLHVFTYSSRPGTPALRLGERVADGELRRRSRRMRGLDRELRRRFAREMLHTVQTLLPESADGDGHWQGLTGNYLRVRFPWRRATPPGPGLRLVYLDHLDADDRVWGRLLGAGL